MPIAPYARVTLDVCDDRGTPYEVDFDDVELISDDETKCDADWSSFRREAAKDILAAIISGDKLHCPLSCEYASEVAIQYADALIAKLKEQ